MGAGAACARGPGTDGYEKTISPDITVISPFSKRSSQMQVSSPMKSRSGPVLDRGRDLAENVLDI